MGSAALGVAVWAPRKDSPEMQEKERLHRWADRWFYVGLVLTALGIALQTLGSVLPLD
jgi:hypothetical protein